MNKDKEYASLPFSTLLIVFPFDSVLVFDEFLLAWLLKLRKPAYLSVFSKTFKKRIFQRQNSSWGMCEGLWKDLTKWNLFFLGTDEQKSRFFYTNLFRFSKRRVTIIVSFVGQFALTNQYGFNRIYILCALSTHVGNRLMNFTILFATF